MKGSRLMGVSGLMFVLIAGFLAAVAAQFAAPEFVDGAASTTVNLSSQVVVGNAAPVVSAVSLNGGVTMNLTADATTTFTVNFQIQDPNGCGEVFYNGNVTTTVFRSGVTAACTASDLNCYIKSTVLAHNCPNPTSTNTTAVATATVDIYYFAQGTDSSSSFSGDTWDAQVAAKDAAGATHSASAASKPEMNSLIAINVTTSSIDYGAIAAGQDTGSTNRFASTTNAGNTTTTVRLHASATLTSGGNVISTSSQHYSSTTFSMPAGGIALSDTATTLAGYLLTSPTSTTNVLKTTYWGLLVPGGTATGTYTGTNVFTALWQP